jgi:hypothetical protein
MKQIRDVNEISLFGCSETAIEPGAVSTVKYCSEICLFEDHHYTKYGRET